MLPSAFGGTYLSPLPPHLRSTSPEVRPRAPMLQLLGALDAEVQRVRELALAALQRESAAMSLRRQRDPSAGEGSSRRPKRRPGSDRSSSVSLPISPLFPSLMELVDIDAQLENAPAQETPEQRVRPWDPMMTPPSTGRAQSEAGGSPAATRSDTADSDYASVLAYGLWPNPDFERTLLVLRTPPEAVRFIHGHFEGLCRPYCLDVPRGWYPLIRQFSQDWYRYHHAGEPPMVWTGAEPTLVPEGTLGTITPGVRGARRTHRLLNVSP